MEHRFDPGRGSGTVPCRSEAGPYVMNVTLVLFDRINPHQRRALGYASYRLACRLHEAGRLARVVCLYCSPDAELPREKVAALADDPGRSAAFELLGRAGRLLPFLRGRRQQETLFDRFAAGQVRRHRDGLVFCSRPLVPATVAAARDAGHTVWVQSSVPHPLLNYALVRNEEIRLGLAGSSAYTDRHRAERLAAVLASADRVATLAPEIGGFTYRSYLQFLPEARLLPLHEYFSIDPAEFTAVAEARESRPAGGGLTFLHVSHVNLIKGIPYLLDAWRLARGGLPAGSRLVIAGRIDRDVRRLVAARYADLDGVEYPGYVADLAETFAGADVFVSPSVADAGPATIIEAMAGGLPVVSSCNCGFASLIRDGENGFTYPYNDSAALAAVLARLAADPAAARALGRNARRGLAAHGIERYGDEILRYVEDLARTADGGMGS